VRDEFGFGGSIKRRKCYAAGTGGDNACAWKWIRSGGESGLDGY